MSEELENLTLQQRMEIAALLPEHDPLRAQILQEYAAAHPPGNNGSAGRLAGDPDVERLKTALWSVPAPATLEARLLTIPDASAPARPVPWWNRPASEILTPRRLSIAAAVVLLIAAGWWAYSAIATARHHRALDQVAAFALNIHNTVAANPPAEHIVTSDPAQAEAWLKPRVNFPAIMLSAQHTKLTSAGIVRLGSAPAALTRWQREGHTYSLFEFAPASLNLPNAFPQRTTHGPSPGPTGQPSKIIIWTEPEKGCGWVLVTNESAPNNFVY